ncbi:MAG: NUDIX domain-containing protein [Nitrospirae bacterium]|nr:NUDIX domain-containing protein [Nitrospirota bacterium]
MKKFSAGLLVYRFKNNKLEVLLVHPGGPFWAKKDEGAWSIPKGEYLEGEDPLLAAKREFLEETGYEINGNFRKLTPLKQHSGKIISAWAVEGDLNVNNIKSNTFTIEWPPHSGKVAEFLEIDRAEWFTVDIAIKKILKGQAGFIEELCGILNYKVK